MADYPLEGRLIPQVVDLKKCNHRTSLARAIKEVAATVDSIPDLFDLSLSPALDFDQLGLMLGAVIFANMGFAHDANSFMDMARNNRGIYKGVIRLVTAPFEEDYESIFGSKYIGYQFLMRMIIVMHLRGISDEKKSMVFSVFASCLSPRNSFAKVKKDPRPAAVNMEHLSKFSEILDQLTLGSVSETEVTSDVITSLEELEEKLQSE
jgi:hypothetical protein